MDNLDNHLYKHKEINRLQFKKDKLLYKIADIQDDIEFLENKINKIEDRIVKLSKKADQDKAYYGTKSIDKSKIVTHKEQIKMLEKDRNLFEEELNFIIDKLNELN